MTSYNAWNMVLDSTGLGNDTTRHWAQDSLLVGNNGMVTKTPTYYVFRHFSQYAQPGAKVVSTTGGDAVAFKNPDGSTVVVMYNSGAANPNYAVSVGGTSYTFAMPGNGWATVKVGP
ncbi:MAG TPA: glycoside hydrolase family 30 beta sandwich domain-containing protein [Polyangiaceae bacterium]